MTRRAKATHAVAGNGTARAAASALRVPTAMKFVVFEDNARGDIPPVELVAGRTRRTARDDLDAERWPDEGGTFSSQAVRR